MAKLSILFGLFYLQMIIHIPFLDLFSLILSHFG